MASTTWTKGIVKWEKDGHWCLSIPFTWLLPEAATFAAYHEGTVVGGPAVRLMPEWIGQYAEVDLGDRPGVLQLHNPDATRTSLGCRNACAFCGVRRIEGRYRELPVWPVRPVVIDSNILQSSDAHFENVVANLEGISGVDFNQGLEAIRFTGYRAERILGLKLRQLRFSWDVATEENPVMAAVDRGLTAGMGRSHIIVYCLINFREEPEEALYRMETLKAAGVVGFPMRYQPLDALRKDDYCAPQWQGKGLRQFVRYWARLVRYGIPQQQKQEALLR